MSTIPAHLIGDERRTYLAGADRARVAYRRRHGASLLTAVADKRAFRLEHAAPMAAAADRGGMSAVRKMHTARVDRLATVTAPGRIGGPVAGDFLATITRDAEHSAARLEALAPVKATRKRSAAAATPAPTSLEGQARELDTAGRTEAAAVARLRRTSKLEPCERHAAHWRALAPADRFRTAVEGGTSTACEGGACTLTPGTDRYAASLVAGGPVTLAELNNYAAREPAAELEPAAPAIVHGAYSRQNGSVTVSGPVCGHLTVNDSREHLDSAGPADADVTCHACRVILSCLSPVDTSADRVADVVTLHPAPDTVPAPMPAMTRAARKATRRELAAQLRAAGIRPEGDAWRDACAAAGLPVPAADEVNA